CRSPTRRWPGIRPPCPASRRARSTSPPDAGSTRAARSPKRDAASSRRRSASSSGVTASPATWPRRRAGAPGPPAPGRCGSAGGRAERAHMADPDAVRRATQLWQEAYRYQMAGDLERAIATYQRSIDVQPTAEAHTFLGWTYSFQNRIEEATAECLKAIEIDPEFGNPYNDIGVYLMQQDRLDEAVPWLEKAKAARRYDPRHFPYLNLGRIQLKQGKWWDALREFEGAARLAPGDAETRKALHTLRGQLN